ncbi:hydrolase [Megasphaera cerevisiae DSM 20462]|jgi:predicted HD superfamily hydrolase involved in NAD metabolism|uniref:bis(5'-nucleosyl)-tetraphosphatase (symmetrical) n=1 Tax=Megasphaera cerevisiae DSM 20462 TaxID=1122219 RepID=A0A0J6ZPH6_9FIRM|nr:bis(5'-nucleosyl)-tetraphosphatase (symmetrical) YqeK [Megasphaera cerevisiae]KMO86796.1 hydrolase [Megasphaera cerevisiae DSM 20462]MCI1750709.1 bis(5'-nucleosyl)-tetraphosphatase (symmetrical) YqeK [Megasphaera cerevisiae]OKY54492.1 hydrolase [Megasphaera cerevisiae]SJZ35527.1 putative HD superfamily hydrolase of NAD metabolism [Megasphaera cerevisiae DSM 20462]
MYNTELKERIRNNLKHTLSDQRYTHVLGVAAAARRLAGIYGYDTDKAEVAGLLHDAAKQLPLNDMQTLARRSFGDTLPLPVMATGSLLHGYAAVTVAREIYGIDDPELLASLAHHTTGAEAMGMLEKIIFVADYIEENRSFEGVEALRCIAFQNLDKAVLAGYDSTIRHLLDQGKTIFTGTVVNRNAQIKHLYDLDRKAR